MSQGKIVSTGVNKFKYVPSQAYLDAKQKNLDQQDKLRKNQEWRNSIQDFRKERSINLLRNI